MDLNSCGDSSLYDEISSLMPSSGDYALDDIDEILRSTDSHLVSPLDLPSFASHNEHDFIMPFVANNLQNQTYLPSNFQENFNFSFPTPETDETGLSFESCTHTHESLRTSSTSSVDDDNCNLEELINFLKDDDIQMELITDVDTPHRNTPSPTDSCSSSSGSSTSGVQSDASFEVSRSQTYLHAGVLVESECSHDDFLNDNSATKTQKVESENWVTSVNKLTLPADPHSQKVALPTITSPTVSTSLPITLPVLPVQANSKNSSSLLQPLPQVQSINLLPGSLIPVKAVSLTTVTSASDTIKPPTVIKIEPKVASKSNEPIISLKTTKVASESNFLNATKITPPTNTKPKMVFLSFNDYKALTEINKKHGKTVTGQPPKIILKTTNGKVITANKITSTGSIPHRAQYFAPKVKTNNVLLKQQTMKGAGTVALQTGTCANSINQGKNLNIYKGIVDEKVWKKQQRMIKNRESASLSRKKKKEYVVSLETRINNLEKENYSLKGENSSLRSQLAALAQTCQCKNSNISEFVLNSLNVNQKIGAGIASGNHVKIAPKPTGKSIKQRMLAANVKKNVALLFAMAFMVSMNVGNFQTYLNKNSIENSIESAPQVEETQATGRRLLWVETENEFKQNVISKKPEGEMDVPPLHFLHPVNRSKVITSEQNHNVTMQHLPLSSSSSKCVGDSNYTENQRLHINLHKWIDGNDYLNLSLHDKYDNGLDNDLRFGKFATSYLERNTFKHPIRETGQPMKRKLFISGPFYNGKHRKVGGSQISNGNDNNNVNESDSNVNDSDNRTVNEKNSLKVFKPKIGEEYLRLFRGIKRQNDTFYVLSFNMDHLLLPASAYNRSARPKMSLMLPAGDPSLNGDIMLMQIDCEVVNTTELEVKSSMIPEKLRPQKYGHGSSHATPNPNDVANNETHNRGPQQRKEKLSIRPEMPKQKSPPKTYYMMGPRSAAAATAMKTKPTLVKLGSNKSTESIILNGKNSTLFDKMRETVEGEIKYN